MSDRIYNKTMFALQPDPPQPQRNTINLSMPCLEGAQFVVGQSEPNYTLMNDRQKIGTHSHCHTNFPSRLQPSSHGKQKKSDRLQEGWQATISQEKKQDTISWASFCALRSIATRVSYGPYIRLIQYNNSFTYLFHRVPAPLKSPPDRCQWHWCSTCLLQSQLQFVQIAITAFIERPMQVLYPFQYSSILRL
jgi:hypothetical protein